MAAITPLQAGGLNVVAFLDLIGWSEGTTTSKNTKNNGYDVIVQGVDKSPKVFTDYSRHPGVLVQVGPDLKSTAAGRYQILERYAKAYIKSLKLPDFSPLSQDLIALQLIAECKATSVVRRGDVVQAVFLCRSRWASFTGSEYGQPTHSIEVLKAQYDKLRGIAA